MVDFGRIGFHTLRGVIQSAIREFFESTAFPSYRLSLPFPC